MQVYQFMDLTTLTYDEFKHEQLKQHMAQLVWLKAMADRNTRFIMLMALFKCLEGQKVKVFLHSWHNNDTGRSLFAQFLCRQTDTHTNRWTELTALLLVHVHGVKRYCMQWLLWSGSHLNMPILPVHHLWQQNLWPFWSHTLYTVQL